MQPLNLTPTHADTPVAAPAVLLVRMSSLGDIVHTFPAVTDFRRARPHWLLHWVVEEQYLDLARLHPGVDRLIPVAIRRWRHALWSARSEVAAARRALGETRYEAVADSQGLIKSALVASQAHGVRTGFARDTAREPLATLFYQQKVSCPAAEHKIERYRKVLARAAGYEPEGAPDYGLAVPAAPVWVPQAPYCVLMHSTARAAKLWSEAAWVEVGRALAERGQLAVLPYGGPDEEARARRLAAAIPQAVLAPAMGYAEAAGLLGHARVVVGLDTGFTHLAAALGTPVVGIFCDSEPVDAHPLGQGPTAWCGGIGTPPGAAEVLAAVLETVSGVVADSA